VGRGLRALAARLAGEQSGFTIIEAVVAMLLLVVGALGVLQLFDAATRNNYRAQQSQVVNDRLQAELEQIRARPYAELGMTSNPGHSSDRNNPRWRVSGPNFAIGRDGTQLRQMVVDGTDGYSGGTVDPGPTAFTVGDVSGDIYRFVVWAPLTGCPSCGGSALKRVVVAATITDAPASFSRAFQEVQTDVVDPDATPANNPAPPADDDDEIAKAEFWLTDTPCNDSTRQPLAGDHATHNTRGVCSDGLETGGTAGAPDLMFTEAPALDPNYPPAGQPLYDYATDVEPTLNPTLDKGAMLRRPSSNGCLATGDLLDMPEAESNRHQKLHKWLSPPLPQDFELQLLGDGTLELYTRALNGAVHAGKICVWLYVHKLNALGAPVDVPVTNTSGGLAYFQYSQSPWPSSFTRVSVPLHFIPPETIQPGERIGLAITVERAGSSPAEGLEFMYDHPDFPSRLELETDRILDF
jgi:type II secretory pathway pseudopilin PulG